ncbi:hypothetical protein OKW98_19560 [Pseudomonas sp. KU26590]|uniref:hypothetical protein n=1 Tax=Pseudomonas sp. KU26590 TaxID=2991051 RepID=UPI00223DD617|nr:hypothetical protein [Pseudomonas sp. KU26590]UZJ58760.1 hypothetical protein OKW98_19560 [Pseudomonas sp. KU26590]
MISKMTQALILSGLLASAGAASASERNVIVPVIAGAAVGAVLAAVISQSNNDRHDRYQDYRPQPRYAPRYQPQYQPQYQQVVYVPVRERVEYRRFSPPQPHGYYDGGYRRGFDQGRGNDRW